MPDGARTRNVPAKRLYRDIGTHAWHLSEYITGLKVKELCADLKAFVPGRPIDDDGAAFLRYENDVTGVLTATQIGNR